MKLNKFISNTYYQIALIAVIIFILYFPSLQAPFLFDDLGYITLNNSIRHLSEFFTQVKLLFSTDRPLTYFSFAVNYHFSKLSSTGYHFTNVLLHMAASVLLYFLVKKLAGFLKTGNYSLLPFFTALIFAAHPMNTESVSYIYNRSSSLAAIFIISTMLLYIESAEQRKTNLFLASLLTMGLAFLSKQTAVILPLLLLLYDFMFISGNISQLLKKLKFHAFYWVLLCLYLIYMLHSALVLPGSSPGYSGNIKYVYPYYLTQPYIIAKFVSMLIIPRGFCIDHVFMAINSLSDPRSLISVIFILLTASVLFYCIKNRSSYTKIILFSILWYLIALIPTSFAIVHVGERHQYLPAIGIYLLISLFLLYLYNKAQNINKNYSLIVIAVLAVYTVVLGITTFKRNILYLNPVLLWEESAKKYPVNTRAYNNIGYYYFLAKNYDLAEKIFLKTLSLYPGSPEANYNLGKLYVDTGKYNKAEKYFEKIPHDNFNYAKALNDTGYIYFEKKDYRNAIKTYEKALKISPDYELTYHRLGITYYRLNDRNIAATYFNKAIEINPDFTDSNYSLGIIYYQKKEYKKAIHLLKKTLLIDRNFKLAHFYLGLIYDEMNEVDSAINEYNSETMINPGYDKAYYNLGVLYSNNNMYREALTCFTRLLNLAPNDPDIKNKVAALQQALGN